jgi:hypothetical protein
MPKMPKVKRVGRDELAYVLELIARFPGFINLPPVGKSEE